MTHLFNGMAPLHHREPGMAGVALTDARVRVGLIADGVPRRTRTPWRSPRTPSVPGCRWSPMRWPVLGRRPGDVGGRVTVAVRRLADGTLAGSMLSLDRAVRNLGGVGRLSLPAALAAVSAAGRGGPRAGRPGPGRRRAQSATWCCWTARAR